MNRFRFDARPSPAAPFTKDEELWYSAEVEGVPGRVMLRLGRGSDDAYVCTALVVDAPGAAVTTSALKNIHIARMIEHLLTSLPPGQDPAGVAYPDPSAHGGFVVWDATPPVPTQRPSRGGRGPDRSDLELFARTYREALNHPDRRRKPVEATAAALNIGVSTAHRWKRLCQAKSLLVGARGE